ncbi:hypothetical protein F4777DRAFT_595495 [Nemania sp. FL0916]|nr:hypothetical protein F4777DRAFT_595495 [Nemania sp. FL0916]
MDEHTPSPLHPLTEQNLNILQGKLPIFIRPPTSSGSLPTDRLERAKRRVCNYLRGLKNIGAKGLQICEMEDVYMPPRTSKVLYRGNAIPEPDLQDPEFWEAKRRDLEAKYEPIVRFERAKEGVVGAMRALRQFGKKGCKILAGYELSLDGENDVRYRRSGVDRPDFDDPAYWEAQWQYLEEKYEVLCSQHRPFSTSARDTSMQREENAHLDWAKEYTRNWPDRVKGIEKWASEQPTGKRIDLPRPRSPASHDPTERGSVNSDIESISDKSEGTIYYRWRSAYMSVYDRMVALWRLGDDGRDIVKNDELRIVDKYDVRFRNSRGPKPDLKDPGYWETKLQYFTEKLLSLCHVRQCYSPLLSRSERKLGQLRSPVPSPASSVLSTVPSRVESLRPSPESMRAFEVETQKHQLYGLLTLNFFNLEGQHIIEDDEIYVAGRYDVRYRHKIGPQPDLQDPEYWRSKWSYYLDQYCDHLRRQQEQAQTITAAPVQEHMHHNDHPSPLETTRTQAAALSTGSKRKRSHLDTADLAESRLSGPEKRIKLRPAQTGDVGIATSEMRPNAANFPTRAGEKPVPPNMAGLLEDANTSTLPRPRRRPRIKYVKQRASRRLAGQPPEFGLLP